MCSLIYFLLIVHNFLLFWSFLGFYSKFCAKLLIHRKWYRNQSFIFTSSCFEYSGETHFILERSNFWLAKIFTFNCNAEKPYFFYEFDPLTNQKKVCGKIVLQQTKQDLLFDVFRLNPISKKVASSKISFTFKFVYNLRTKL